MNYRILFFVFLLSCNSNVSNKQSGHVKEDTLKRSLVTTATFGANIKSKNYSTSADTVSEFVRGNLYYSSLIDLSFCQSELVKLLKNDSCKRKWRNKIEHLYTMYDNPENNINTGSEIDFFKHRLNEQDKLKEEFPVEYNFLIRSLPNHLTTPISINTYQKWMLRFAHAGGGNFSELSGVYYSFLITDGVGFVNAIEANSNCTILFRKWINSLEDTEFVAYGSDNVPPQVLERKRNYLVDKYSLISDSLMKEAIIKIKDAKVRSID